MRAALRRLSHRRLGTVSNINPPSRALTASPACAVVMPAKYNADGTGRDTYIRRDPVECFGKNLYKAEPRLITRMGNAGCRVPRQRGAPLGETDPVGGNKGSGFAFERPARFIRHPVAGYPAEINQYTTMKDLVQDAYVTSQQLPGHLNHISGTTVFKPRCPPSVTEWAEVSGGMAAPLLSSWPELVGLQLEDAATKLQADRPDVLIEAYPLGAVVSSEINPMRVRIFVVSESDKTVAAPPTLG